MIGSDTKAESTDARLPVLSWLLRPPVFRALFVLTAILRVWMTGTLGLASDEAYYWVWSRHLSLSYFDHPPMVAWLIRVSTTCLGDAEVAIRFPFVVLSLASIPVAMWGARAIAPAAAGLTGLILLLNPVTALVGMLATPDGPVWFFGCGAMAAACRAVRAEGVRAGKYWLVFGLSLGLALLSKYTAALIGPAVFLGLLTSGEGRAHLRRPWFWAGAVVASACFAPVISWNAAHEWASFKYQLGHGLRATSIPWWRGVGDLLGGMFLAWTPLLFVLTLLGAIRAARTRSKAPLGAKLMLWCLAVPMGVFLFSATRRRVELNWPLLMSAPAAAIAAAYVAKSSRAVHIAAAVAVCGAGALTLGMQFPPVVVPVLERVPSANQLFGYKEFGHEVSRIAEGRPVFANRYQDAAQLTYHMPGHPAVWALNRLSRPNAYDFFGGGPDLNQVESAVFINFEPRQHPPPFEVSQTFVWPTVVGGRTVRTDTIVIGEWPYVN